MRSGSTLLVNSGNYLERHLRYAIEETEPRPLGLIAIGIGHNVTRSATIVDMEELAMTEKLPETLRREGLAAEAAGILPPNEDEAGKARAVREHGIGYVAKGW
jgi:cobaltochelatase CobT